MKIIKKESLELKEKYGDERKTKISNKAVGDFTDMDLIPNEQVVVTMTVGNYIKRQNINEYRTQRRGGKGVIGMTTKEEDQISVIQVAQNHDDILFFTNRGRVFRQKVFEIPQASRIAKGTAAVNIVQLAPEEKITALLAMSEGNAGGDLVMITHKGVIKKTALAAYANIRSNGLIAIKLDEGDELGWVRRSQPGDEIMIVTRDGQSIRFHEDDARPLGRSTRGVRAIKIRTSDVVIGADVAKSDKTYGLLVVSEHGQGKQTLLSQYTLQHRGGVGIKTMQITPKTGKIIGAKLVERSLNSDLIITSKDGQMIRLPFKTVPTLGRATQGVRVMRMKPGDKVASFTVLLMEEADGTLSNPNEELDEAELAKLPALDRLEEATEPETKAPTKKPKAEKASLSPAKKLTVGVYDPKSKKANPVVKKKVAVAAKPAAKKKAPAKPVAKKPATKAKSAPKEFARKTLKPSKPVSKGFIKRKLK